MTSIGRETSSAKRKSRISALLAATIITSSFWAYNAPANAEGPRAIPDAKQSDPVANEIMSGFPPAPKKTVRFADGSGYRFPLTRWSFNHMRELVPTANVRRGESAARTFSEAPRALASVAFKTMDGVDMTLSDALAKTYTDGIIVLHKGQRVYEQYFGAAEQSRPHIVFSMTKSFVGTLAATLAAEGALDVTAPVAKYVPELEKSAYGDATVREVMDMRIGLQYSEDYSNPNAEVFDYATAGGMIPAAPDYTGPRNFYDYLIGVKKQGEHGDAFAYKTPNAEVLAWIVKRASGKSLASLLSERIWSKIGAEEDGYFTVDSVGSESGGGGFNATLRDLARFGEAMRNGGKYNNQQIVPAAAVKEIFAGGDKQAFAKAGIKTLAGWSYKDMWWVSHNAHGAIMARGIHGQNLYIDPAAEMVIARVGSHPIGSNIATDPIVLPAYAAIAEALMAK